jgi:hypothetical protein
MATATKILERVKVREVAGVFRSRDRLDAAVHALLSSGTCSAPPTRWGSG